MVYEKPVIDKREVLRALDPVHGRGDREFDRLRRAELLSPGIEYGREESGGPSPGLELFCSLNRDVISALRNDRTDTAHTLRAHAQRIERETIGPWLEALDDLDTTIRSFCSAASGSKRHKSWVDHVLFEGHAEDVEDVASPIWSAAREVAEVRAQFQDRHAAAQLTVGRVWKIDGTWTEVRPMTRSVEDSFAFFTEEILAADLRLGDPVVIRHEELAAGVILTTIERGVESTRKLSALTGQSLPRHLEELLDATRLGSSENRVRPLRRVA